MPQETRELDEFPCYFLVVETQKTVRGIRFTATTFSQLVEPLDRRFAAIVERHDADAYDKTLDSWRHLMALIFAQLSAVDSLRGLATAWNANPDAHYHLDCGADRPLHPQRGDETPPPHRLHSHPPGQAVRLGRVQRPHPWHEGHVVYDPGRNLPRLLAITHANVNDAQIGRTVEAEPGLTFAIDKGYCHYGWWSAVHAAKAFFVTRPKDNMRLRVVAERQSEPSPGNGFVVMSDQEVAFASKGDSKLTMPLRRIRVRRDLDGKTIDVITNDMKRSSIEVARVYKFRWQIELLFRWLKQHLKLRSFMGINKTPSDCKSSRR